MVLQMFIDGILVDATPLSVDRINDEQERRWYIQGAILELLEKWKNNIEDMDMEPRFYISDKTYYW